MSKLMRIKICCIASVEEAALAIRFGANAVGFVSAMPSGPGVIPDDRIAQIVPSIPPGIATFLLTSAQDAETIIAQQRKFAVSTLQIVDTIAPASLEAIRTALPGVALVKVIHVAGPDAVTEAIRVAPLVDALLLDSGNPSAPVKELGGTGRVHDWSISRTIVERSPVPVFLAGGLKPENVAEAIRTVRPFGVDVCSGVRVNRVLDESRLAAYVSAVREA